MRFIVSSTDLLQGLLSVQKVIASKSSLPILDNFLFTLDGSTLTVTGSDSETTLKTILTINEVMEGGEIAVPAKLLTDSLKELPTQPIEFSSDDEKNIVNIIWASGSAQIPFTSAEDYPTLKELVEPTAIRMKGSVLADGINSTLYATGDEELRPVMNGIFFDIAEDSTTLVASNAHKLVYYRRHDIKSAAASSFILPKKPANILKANLAKCMDEEVEITFDRTNCAYFKFNSFLIFCKLVDGTYPAYKSVIPKNNTNVITVSRAELLNATKRVAVCSNQATGQIVFKLADNSISITAQDLDFSMSAHETVGCEYDGSPMEIGFKSTFLIEILGNLQYDQICIRLSDPNRAALIQPAVQTEPDEEICALLMPMRINN
ncbi:MAG: DNA polymerase III subunit beta [Bacteroidales bacterium]|nr:DNA polymerase III subunit beta [Bacteroidales bacterium]MBR4088573.1 DNA polymerase III subunit beta [Bacteroidales bacterium]